MLAIRRTAVLWAVGSSAPGTDSTGNRVMSFQKRYNELLKDEHSPLHHKEYVFMQERLEEYKKLQVTYSVKQTDVERARKAAQMCGLEFTGKGTKTAPKTNSA